MDIEQHGRPAQIALIRHAEKPTPVGAQQGVDLDGVPHLHSLIVRGWQRAGALVPLFCDDRDSLLRRPTRVYSPPAHGTDGDHGRPYETVLAVAERLGTKVETAFTLGDEDALVADVLRSPGIVLIGWEHKRIPRIANALLGNDASAPQEWPDDRFDVVWVFDHDVASGTYRFSQRPQLLLAGDRAEPIA